MPLTCNIDAKGKAARLTYGLIMIAVSILIATLWAWSLGSVIMWIIAASCFVAGAFGVFEGWAGWCVVRAMGFKTRI